MPDKFPPGLVENDDGALTAGQILLVTDVPVGRDKDITEFASTLENGSIQVSSGKFQYRLDLFPSDRELLDHLVNGHTALQVFKDDGHGCARSMSVR